MITAPTLEHTEHLGALSRACRERTARVAVVGLGYVGLPMAIAFAEAGFPTVGIEADAGRCELLNGGRSYISDLDDGRLRAAIEGGGFQASSDPALLRDA